MQRHTNTGVSENFKETRTHRINVLKGGFRRRFYDFFFAENDIIPKHIVYSFVVTTRAVFVAVGGGVWIRRA